MRSAAQRCRRHARSSRRSPVLRGQSMSGRIYQTSRIKRSRATRAEIEERGDAYFNIVAARPMTVRQVFYQATVRGIVEKTENGYAKVQTDLAEMRRDGPLPYGWLADNTRWQRWLRSCRPPGKANANSFRALSRERSAMSGLRSRHRALRTSPIANPARSARPSTSFAVRRTTWVRACRICEIAKSPDQATPILQVGGT